MELVALLGHGEEGLLDDLAAVGDVFQGQDDGRLLPGLLAQGQALQHVAEGGDGGRRVLDVLADGGIVEVQLAAHALEVVAAGGDGHGDHLGARVGDLVVDLRRLVRGEDGIGDGADQAEAVDGAVMLVKGVEAALLAEAVRLGAAAGLGAAGDGDDGQVGDALVVEGLHFRDEESAEKDAGPAEGDNALLQGVAVELGEVLRVEVGTERL